MDNIIGKYQPNNTIIHKLDPKIKLIGLIIFIVSIFLKYGNENINQEYMTLIILSFYFILLLIIAIIAKVSFLILFKQLKLLWVMVLFILVFNLFFNANISEKSEVFFYIYTYPIYYISVINIVYILSRIIILLFASLIFTTTTKPIEMTRAIEFLFSFLKIFKIPVHKFAMSLSLAIRFIPYLFENANIIMNAQASRGVDFKNSKFKTKIKAITTLIIPLFVTSFSTSLSLADALEARGYNPSSKRTKYKYHSFNVIDLIFIILLSLFLAFIIIDSFLRIDIFYIFKLSVPILK